MNERILQHYKSDTYSESVAACTREISQETVTLYSVKISKMISRFV